MYSKNLPEFGDFKPPSLCAESPPLFFLLTRYQSKISGIGVTPLTSSTVQWHTSITAPPLFEVYNGVKCWLHRYLLFFVWPCSLARSCRRCCCRSAAREGELQGRWPSRHAALLTITPPAQTSQAALILFLQGWVVSKRLLNILAQHE